MSEGPIPGSDPGACPTCGCWRKAGVIHRCTICTAEHLGWDDQNRPIPPRSQTAVTDEMVDRALLTYWGTRNLDRWDRPRPWTPQQLRGMREALEAALDEADGTEER